MTREPIESMRDALDLIERLDEQIDKLEEFVANLVWYGMEYGTCRCGDWQLWDNQQKNEIMERVKEFDTEIE